LEKISETLERLVLESDRIRMEQVEMIDFVRLSGVVAAFMERIEEIGPNPYKGF
jgi:quinone-modifying oxidoreductase subunit QmoB